MSELSQVINQIKKNENNIIQKIDPQQLGPILEHADYVYHQEGKTPIFSDHLYDILRNRLEELDPDNSFFSKVGAEDVKQNKVKLPFWLGSMDKFKADNTQIPRWVSKYKGPYMVSEKLDGISLLIIFSDNGNVSIFTRGNGSYGRDVSYIQPIFGFKKVISSIQKMRLSKIAVRGEMIVSKENFKKYNEFKKSRNMISGIVNRKEQQDLSQFIGKIDFVAFELIEPRVSVSQQYELMKQFGLKVALHTHVPTIDKHILSQLLPKFRNDSDYEIDGIIITDDNKNTVYPVNQEKNPKYAFAFKMINNDEVAETRVIDVDWNASKDGYLMPKVIIEQVILNGSKINKTSGKNAKFIKLHKIGIGSVVKVTLDGGVVPGILEVVEPSDEAKMPTELSDGLCVWDATETNLKLINLSGNHDIKIKQLVYFFKQIKTENLDVGIIAKLVDHGFDSIPKVLLLTKNNLLSIEGFKDRLAQKIIGNIQTSFQKASLLDLMVASNAFGRGLGSKKLSIILKEYPNIIHQSYSSEQLYDMVLKLDGFSDKTTTLFVNSIPVFKQFMIDIGASLQTYQVKTTKKKINSEKSSFEGQKIVMTGFRDKDIASFIEEQGGEVTNSVSKNTSLLICKNISDSGSKITRAKELQIPIINVEQFKEKYLS